MKCLGEDCERAGETRGMCSKHYQRWLKRHHDRVIRRPKMDDDIETRVDISAAEARVETEIRSGLRCRCGMLRPCEWCPRLDAERGRGQWHWCARSSAL